MFTQVNYEINRQMIARVLATLDLNEKDTVLDLFRLGQFTLPMARFAGASSASKAISRWSSRQGKCRHNAIENVEFYAADLSKDISGQTWANRKYNKILLDPSRRAWRSCIT